MILSDMDDTKPVEGSLLDADSASWLERSRLRNLWSESNTHDVPCHGCGTAVRTWPNGGGRGRWCDRCLPIATDMSVIRSAAKKFVRYGLTDAAAAAEKALADLRAIMRANGRGA